MRDPYLRAHAGRRICMLTANDRDDVDGTDALPSFFLPPTIHRPFDRPIGKLEGAVRQLGLSHKESLENFIVIVVEAYEDLGFWHGAPPAALSNHRSIPCKRTRQLFHICFTTSVFFVYVQPFECVATENPDKPILDTLMKSVGIGRMMQSG
ncbi:hypothetical protein AJ87_07500 [Rhizobium yanglingense]|nr:hypothetical protein AJ87_07500 [Rhizobium yanglingense]